MAIEDQGGIRRGLAGVVVDTTAISTVTETTNVLIYRGYAVQDLAARCRFEEVAYLIWNGELPTRSQLAAFEAEERRHRALDPVLLEVLARFPGTAHPMDALRTAVSFMGMEDSHDTAQDEAAMRLAAIKMMARIPTAIAALRRLTRGESPIPPRADLSFAENFFHMCFGEVPEPEIMRCFEIALILYAEHGFNASTFAARVIASTRSDIYAAAVGGIAALKGSLHGGANEAVMRMMLEIGQPARVEAWIQQALSEKRVIMGFGHRVYKEGDSRVPIMRDAFKSMAVLRDGSRLIEIYDRLAAAMLETKGIHPNLDFPAGPAYYLMGFEIPLFTPLFVISRIVGWTAHVLEQAQNNKLIRPLASYSGKEERNFVFLEKR